MGPRKRTYSSAMGDRVCTQSFSDNSAGIYIKWKVFHFVCLFNQKVFFCILRKNEVNTTFSS